MSIAGAFGPTFFFRVILPGVVLAAELQPILLPLSTRLHIDSVYGLSAAGLFGVVTVAAGLVLAAADRPIYYLFEGFAWRVLTRWNRRRLWQRLDRLAARQIELHEKRVKEGKLLGAEKLEASRIAERLRDFPVVFGKKKGRYKLSGPTLLANVIAAYEQYSKSRYGIDGEFFLPHIFYLAPDGAQADLESSGAIADGMVLSCFSAISAGLAHVTVLFGMAVGAILTMVHWKPMVVSPEGPGVAGFYAGTAALAAVLFYFLSLSGHREYGRRVRAVVDIVAKKLGTLATRPLPDEAARSAVQARREYLETLHDESAD
jgi:hypothetical protein